jgi:hypothetical protein
MFRVRRLTDARTMLVLGMAVVLALFSTPASGGGNRAADAGNEGSARVFPPGSRPYGASYSEWTVRWWQWSYSLPVAGHPLFDESGANCGAGQSGPVWFLGGVFNVSGSADRTLCSVPAGKALLFPILNVEWDNACPPDDLTFEELRAIAASFMDLATNMTVEVDGRAIENLESYRFTAGPFGVDIPSGSIWEFFGCPTPAGHYEPLAADGFYLMLTPLPPGPHVIHFRGTVADPVNFTLDITYHLTVTADAHTTAEVPLEPGVEGPGGIARTNGPKPTTTWGHMKATYR